MKRFLVLTVIGGVGFLVRTHLSRSKPKVAKAPLSEDQKQIYESFVKSETKEVATHMTLASTTSPLFLSGFMLSCLKDLHLTNLEEVQQTVHVIASGIATQSRVTLVDRRHYKIADPGRAIKNGQDVGNAVAEGFASASGLFPK